MKNGLAIFALPKIERVKYAYYSTIGKKRKESNRDS